jgi:hypothetical protein
MKSDATKKLFRANLIAAILCLLFLLWLAVSYPNVATMWSHPDWVAEQMQKAKTTEELTTLFQMATARVSHSQSMTDGFFSAVVIAQFGIFGFLCFNVFRIARLHRQISKDDTAPNDAPQ